MLTVEADRSRTTPVAERPRTRGAATSAPTVTDERLLTFEHVVEMHQANVARLARRLLGWSEAKNDVDDVVQDVFLAVLKGLPSFRGRSSLSTWITRITINACRAHRRKRMLRVALWDRWTRHAPTSNEPGELPDERDETHSRVRQAVGGLPNRYREVVVLRYLEGMDVDEIGRVINASRSAIEVRLHRARAMLKEVLGSLMDER
jgi:RNA polymerase sigma-70 factor (ECF subfamily)